MGAHDAMWGDNLQDNQAVTDYGCWGRARNLHDAASIDHNVVWGGFNRALLWLSLSPSRRTVPDRSGLRGFRLFRLPNRRLPALYGLFIDSERGAVSSYIKGYNMSGPLLRALNERIYLSRMCDPELTYSPTLNRFLPLILIHARKEGSKAELAKVLLLSEFSLLHSQHLPVKNSPFQK